MGKTRIGKEQVEACKRIHEKFSNAAVVQIVYHKDGAEAMAVHPDGVREFVFEPYRQAVQMHGQHYRAMNYIKNYV